LKKIIRHEILTLREWVGSQWERYGS
jgi:hypothetical protein